MRRIVAIVCISLAACAGIIGLRREQAETFPHRAHVLKGVTCTRCHAGVGTTPGLHIPDEASCAECHKDTKRYPDTALTQLVEVQDHLKFDHGRHMTVAKNNCMRCHSGVGGDDEHMRPTMATCFKCHDKAERGRDCKACHKDLAEEGTLPSSHLAHDGDWLREHGSRAASSGDLCETCHKESFCASCHGVNVAALPAKQNFGDPFRASVHRAGFISRHSLEARSDPGACTTCHQPESCSACHVDRGVADNSKRNPHPAGWVGPTQGENRHGREARRDPASCAGCHGGAGEQLCVTCHSVGGVGGNPHPPGWSSNQPLSAMPCRMCHPLGTSR